MKKLQLVLLFVVPLLLTCLTSCFFASNQLLPDKMIVYDESLQQIVLIRPQQKNIIVAIESDLTNSDLPKSTVHKPAPKRIEIKSWWLANAMQKLPTTEAVEQFIEGERKLREFASGPVRLILDNGEVVPLEFRKRGWRDLNFSFWLHRILALLLFGFAGWVYWLNPRTRGAVVTLLGSWSLAIGYLIATSNFDRQWAVDATVIKWNFIISRAMVFVFAWSVFSLAWSLPFLFRWQHRLRFLPHLVAAYFIFCYLVNVTGYFSSMSLWYIFPYTVVIVGSMLLLIAKAIVARRHIQTQLLDWVALRWVLGAAFIGVSFPTVYNLLWDMGLVKEINPVLANAPVILFKLGLAALVVRFQLYRLEKFWWGYRTLIIFLITLLFLTFAGTSLQLKLNNETLIILMLIALLLAWYSSAKVREKFRISLVNMTSEISDSMSRLGFAAGRPHQAQNVWRDLLNRTFYPFASEFVIQNQPDNTVQKTTIIDDGAALLIPSLNFHESEKAKASYIRLNGASEGKRIFTESDIKIAEFLRRVAQKSVDAYNAYRSGETTERKRIAADLHDDIGGRLLFLSSAKGRFGEVAQMALDDLRNLTRGLSEADRSLTELCADIEYDQMERCEIKQVYLSWNCDLAEHGLHPVNARAATILNCIISELIRNALQHEQVKTIKCELQIRHDEVLLQVENDGAQTDPQCWRKGLGLNSLMRRVREIGGDIVWQASANGGVISSAHWPLPNWLGTYEVAR
jgi:signal transduction histidine kinase